MQEGRWDIWFKVWEWGIGRQDKVIWKATCNKDIAIDKFFFELLHNVSDAYPIVFSGGGRNKPHSTEYREFSQKWGNLKALYEIADSKIEKVAEIYQMYLNDYFQFLSYLIEKSEMEEKEDAYQEVIRKAKSKHKWYYGAIIMNGGKINPTIFNMFKIKI